MALFQFEGLRDRVLDTANIAVEHSYHRDELQDWRLVAILTNEGPGTAQIVNSVLTPTNSMCFNVRVDAETGDVLGSTEVATGLECGFALVDATSRDQTELPGVFARKPDDEGILLEPAIYSATARDFRPSEVLWFEFSFETSPQVDEELAAAGVETLVTMLGQMTITGDRVEIRFVEPTFTDHTAASDEG